MTSALIALAVVFALAGIGKLFGVSVVRENFQRWGKSDQQRLAIGALEIVLAVLAVIGIGSNGVAIGVAIAALVMMAGALRTHIGAHDEPKEYLPLIVVVVAAIVVLVTV